MLRRSDGKYLLTQEIYEMARKSEPIPYGIDSYDGGSLLHIRALANRRAEYYLGTGSSSCFLGYVDDHPIEEMRAMCMPNFQPLPSETPQGISQKTLQEMNKEELLSCIQAIFDELHKLAEEEL